MTSNATSIMTQLVVKSQILAGGRGLGTFKSGLKGGVHIVKADQVEDIAGNAYSPHFIIKTDIFFSQCSICMFLLFI